LEKTKKDYMFKKWWLVQDADGEWTPTRVTTFFGVPFFYEGKLQGPFKTLTECTDELCRIVVCEYRQDFPDEV